MKKNLKFKITIAGTLLFILLFILSGCSKSSKIPDDYDYDDLSEYLKLGNYKGVEYELKDTQVTQSEVQQYIDEVLLESADIEQKKEGIVKNDSVVNIDYTGSLNGVEFEGGSATDTMINIADSNFIPGFAEGIIGHKVGETFDINVTFPENYGNDDLAGKNTVFKITINYIELEKTPDYNDNWVKKNTEFNTIAEYEKSIKEEIEDGKKRNAVSNARQEVLAKIIDDSKVVKYPQKEYDSSYNRLVDTYKSYAENSDIKFEEYLETEMGLTKKEFEQIAKETVEKAVKQELVLHSIARLEKIEITAGEYTEYLDKLLKDAGYTRETYEEEYGYTIEEYAESNNLFNFLLYQKVMDKVMEYSEAI
ncbi:MAG TPA: trigger factor [Mogibacterium sp.]|nr:trigger factor [Mogibacterium sp.]